MGYLWAKLFLFVLSVVVVSIGPKIEFIVQVEKVWPRSGSLGVARSLFIPVVLKLGRSM